jgi:hypothetical protein
MFWFFGQLVDRQFSPEDRLPYIEAPRGEQAIELSDLEIQVTVSGLLAETTQTMRFYNPNDRVLEGNLSFPLPDNTVVCGYALDVEGKLVDGVVTPKQEARRILEAEERKGADPGLLEQVQGNVYRTRIYPIPPRGARTVRITYISNLTVDGSQAAYHLPLTHAAGIESVSLRAEVVQAPVAPVITGGLGNMALNRWEDRWVAEAKLGRGLPAEDLQIRLPDLPDRFTTVENKDGESFFCISSKLGEYRDEPAWMPKRVAIAWDASGSRQSLEREYDLLPELLAAWNDTVVDVVVFRNRLDDERRSFAPGDIQAADLLTYLQGLPYDGGTDLTALDLSSPAHAECEAWLLFTDGLGTIDPGLPTIGALPVIAVTGQAHSNAALLQHLAQATGGRYLNLLRTSTDAAVREIVSGGQAPRIVESDGCADTHVIAGQGRLAVLGRLTKEEASLAISGLGGTPQTVTVRRSGAVAGDLVARAWAGLQTQVLGLTLQPTADEILTLARTHGLVTPGTSLLVLESLEQYLEYRIEPPASLPEMRAAYDARIAENTRADEQRQASHLDRVIDLWQQRVQWWEQEFDYRPIKQRPRRSPGSELAPGAADGGAEGYADFRDDMPRARRTRPSPGGPAGGSFAAMAAPPAAAGAFEADFDISAEPALGDSAIAGAADLPSAAGAIRIKPWTPDTPYLTAMREGAAEEAYAVYLEQRPEYAASPAFFLDCGDYLLSCGHKELGIRVLSNLVEAGLDDSALMRSFAWRLQQADDLNLAIAILERVREARGDEPQSHRDLALALSRRWERNGDKADALRAMDLLHHVILNSWANFPEIEIIALMELNRLIHLAQQKAITIPTAIDSRLIRLLDLDVRISMSWDADLTDIDLHVFEPTGEHAYYGHNRTQIGGLVSRDFTQGYGPEEYVLHRAYPGAYTVKAHYYGSHQQMISGSCTVIVDVYTNYGRASEKHEVLTLRLDRPSDEVTVGEVTIDAGSLTSATNVAREALWPAKFGQIRKGMTLDDVTGLIGQPVEIRGDERTVLVYRPAPGVEINIAASPRVVAVQQIMDGATLDLV